MQFYEQIQCVTDIKLQSSLKLYKGNTNNT
jgi:hypothetical protein